MGQKKQRFLALGDSYTIGEKVSPHQRWPNQLAHRLASAGIEVEKPTIIAKTGWTTADLLASMRQSVFTSKFDLLTLLIGVNNQYQKLDLREYQLEFKQLLQKAILISSHGSSGVIVLSIPDWSVTPSALPEEQSEIRRQIECFNRIIRLESEAARVKYLDITPISRRLSDDFSYLSPDQLHPSGKMYAQWADLIFPIACQILRR